MSRDLCRQRFWIQITAFKAGASKLPKSCQYTQNSRKSDQNPRQKKIIHQNRRDRYSVLLYLPADRNRHAENKERQRRSCQKSGKPDNEPGARIPARSNPQKKRNQSRKHCSLYQAENHAVQQKRCQPLKVGAERHWCSTPCCSNSLSRFNSLASIVLSSSRLRTSSS